MHLPRTNQKRYRLSQLSRSLDFYYKQVLLHMAMLQHVSSSGKRRLFPCLKKQVFTTPISVAPYCTRDSSAQTLRRNRLILITLTSKQSEVVRNDSCHWLLDIVWSWIESIILKSISMLSGNKLELCIGVDGQCVNGPTRVFINMKASTLFGKQCLPCQGKITVTYCSDMAAVNRMPSNLEKCAETEYGFKERWFR
jgi:hypothetical protein